MDNFETRHKRAKSIFYAIETGVAILVVIVFSIFPWEYGLLATGWLIQNALFYNKGSYEICIDEYELDGYPNLGLEKMLNSWYVSVPVMIVLACVMAFLSQVAGLAALGFYTFFVLLSCC